MSAVRFRPWPPLFSAQPFSVGCFHLRIPQAARVSEPFCVCRQSMDKGPRRARFAPVPPSLLSKPAPTSSPWHTHAALCVRELCACRRYRLSRLLGATVHHANVPAAPTPRCTQHISVAQPLTRRARLSTFLSEGVAIAMHNSPTTGFAHG